MEQEYCIIYGYNDVDPGPFIIGVTKDQNMIDGFRQEHYHFCRGGEVTIDGFYDNLAPDYEIQYTGGHYLTPVMITEFIEYLTAEYNQLFMLFDNIERDVDNLIFNEAEQAVVEEGIDLLREHLNNLMYTMNTEGRYGEANIIEDSVYGSILNIPLCLDNFLSTYQPKALMI
jgi:hypothetical protein